MPPVFRSIRLHSAGAVAEGHPERKALPLHAAAESSVCAADSIVSLKDDAGAYGVCTAGNEGRPRLEARESVLLNGEGMDLSRNSVWCRTPLLLGRIVGCEVGLPECDMAHSSDAVNEDELCALSLECRYLLGKTI